MALWTPDDLSSPCDFWFDVQNGNLTKDGSDLVSQLDDESSNTRHWTASSTAQPLWVASGVNSKASIRCDASPDVMTFASSFPSSSLLQAGLQGGTSRFYFEHDDSLGGGSYNEQDGDATTPHVWVYVWNATTWSLYRDGNLEGSGSHGNTIPDEGIFFHCSDLTGAGPNNFGRMFAGPGLGGAGTAAIFNRGAGDRGVSGDFTLMGLRIGAVTTAEREYIEGWACWRAGLEANLPGGHPYAGAAPTTGYTLAASGGVFALSGQTASLLRAALLGANAGSYALTGQVAALNKGTTLAAAAGAFILSGQAANLTKEKILSADAGALTLSGQAVSFSRAPILIADMGSFAMTGQAAVLDWSGSSIWTPVSEAGGAWAATDVAGGVWTPIPPASTTWTSQ